MTYDPMRIYRPPLRDEDGNVLPEPTAEQMLAAQAARHAEEQARQAVIKAAFDESWDRKRTAIAAQPARETRNGYRVVKDPDFDGVYHLLDETGESITNGKLSKVRKVADELEPARGEKP